MFTPIKEASNFVQKLNMIDLSELPDNEAPDFTNNVHNNNCYEISQDLRSNEIELILENQISNFKKFWEINLYILV